MTRKIFLIFALFFSNQSFSSNYEKHMPLINHMVEVNKEWGIHKDFCSVENYNFSTDENRIQKHLFLVIEYLEENTNKQKWSSDQKANRVELIDALKNYANRKVFPTNHYHSQRTPYFVDNYGVHCAVGYLIKESGSTDLVAQINKNYNYDYIEDMEVPELVQWAAKYGFTIDELKWVQPGYPPSEPASPIGQGANGVIHHFFNDYTHNRLVFSGTFTELDGVPCMNIGVYKNNQLSCVGSGITGKINAIHRDHNGNIMAFGAFENAGQNYTIAKFENGYWEYENVGTFVGGEITAVFPHGGIDNFEVAFVDSSASVAQEIWFKDVNGWTKKASINGIVNTINASGMGRVFAGHFTMVEVFENGVMDTSFTTNNVAIMDHHNDIWHGISDSNICDEVKDVEIIGNAIYFAGGNYSNLGNPIIISRYVNNDLQPIVKRNDISLSDSVTVYDITFDQNNKLLVAGEFEFQSGMLYGNRLAEYDLVSGFIKPIAILDSSVLSIALYDNELIIGGAFIQGYSSNELNHLARIANTSSAEQLKKEQLSIYPNPTDDQITIEFNGFEIAYLTIKNSLGQEVENVNVEGYFKTTLSLAEYKSGIYLIEAQSKDGQGFVRKVVKK